SSILSVSTELIKKTLDRIHNTAISGVTGITGQAFKLACNNDHGRAFLKQSVNNFLNTGNIDRVVCLKRLIALPKGEDKIRPVTPGEVVGKVFGEVLRSYLEGPVKKLLGDELQLGVMCDGGAETVLNSIYAAAEVGRRQGKKVYTVALDFANAFNTVLPKAVIAAIHRLKMDGKIKNAVLQYLKKITLIYENDLVEMACGVAQGDLLS
ncbi:hypothetical protein ADUPG1_003593, partial [Aduncisulcus paluster]